MNKIVFLRICYGFWQSDFNKTRHLRNNKLWFLFQVRQIIKKEEEEETSEEEIPEEIRPEADPPIVTLEAEKKKKKKKKEGKTGDGTSQNELTSKCFEN